MTSISCTIFSAFNYFLLADSDLILKFPWRRENGGQENESDKDVKPGEYVLRHLFLEFCRMAERKIELVLAEPLVRHAAFKFNGL